ncbi:MAG: UvrB/UvrC motif-containing protein [bacterium]|nr:UvrB/UvrC motif-containing protein [bacterium]
MTLEDIKKLDIPDAPGVYFWRLKGGKGRPGQILYIGKATSLKDRVRSYFAPDLIETRGPRMVDMVFKAHSVDWQETDSVLEAMIAEANLIKKHWPDYNVRDKDDKSFNYVVITKEDFPRILVLRGRSMFAELEESVLEPKKTFGPFPNGAALREALKIIRKMFPYIDRHSYGKDKYNFYRQLGLTPDTSSEEARIEYAKTVRHICLFFEGKKGELVKELEREMKAYAKAQEFEKAQGARNKLYALDHIQDIALVKEDIEALSRPSSRTGGTDEPMIVYEGGYRIEAYDTAHMSGKESAGVMTVVIDGEVAKSEYRKFKLSPDIGNNDVASLREIIERRLNHTEWPLPHLMVIDGGEAQRNLAQEVLNERDQDIALVAVVKDARHKPKGLIGAANIVETHKKAILLANAEAHRFALAYHRKLRRMRDDLRGKL